MTIPTKLETKNVDLIIAKLPSNQKPMLKSPLKITTNWLLPLPNNQYQSALKLTQESSNSTVAVSLIQTNVESILTTALKSLVMVPISGMSETLGEVTGVSMVTSRSKETLVFLLVSAVSP